MPRNEGALESLVAAVRACRLCEPHPSPRNTRGLAVNPWFEQEVIPALRQRVSALPERFSEIA